MGKSVKVSSVSKKSFKESEITELKEEKEIVKDMKNIHVASVYDSDDDDDEDAPETVSMSTSKSQIISQIKSEREARRKDRETKRQKAVNLQEQKRQSRQRKAKEVEELEDEVSQDEDESNTMPVTDDICPLPENILASAITQQQQQRQIRFESSDYETDLPVSTEEILETVRLQKAKANKRRLVDSLPYAVVEVGVNGKARISKAEIKARRLISKMKMQSSGAQVRRIDSVLDRARKNRTASAVFYRNNSFY